VKSWIRIRIKVKIQKLYVIKMKPWRAVNAQNGGLKELKMEHCTYNTKNFSININE
jgi:hypothetical protein